MEHEHWNIAPSSRNGGGQLPHPDKEYTIRISAWTTKRRNTLVVIRLDRPAYFSSTITTLISGG
jgi:hypothetical protein